MNQLLQFPAACNDCACTSADILRAKGCPNKEPEQRPPHGTGVVRGVLVGAALFVALLTMAGILRGMLP